MSRVENLRDDFDLFIIGSTPYRTSSWNKYLDAVIALEESACPEKDAKFWFSQKISFRTNEEAK